MAEVFADALGCLSPAFQSLALSLPADFLAEFSTQIAIKSGERTLSELRAQEKDEREQELSGLVTQTEQLVDDVLDALMSHAENHGVGRHMWPSNYRGELHHELNKGCRAELEAVQTATIEGNLSKFFESRNLPGYQAARNSVETERARRRGAGSNQVVEGGLVGSSFDEECRQLRSDPDAYFKGHPAMKEEFGQWVKETCCRTLPDTLLKYWLPYALWAYCSGDVLRILTESTAGGVIESDQALRQKLVKQLGSEFKIDAGWLDSDTTKFRFQGANSAQLDTAVSRMRLHRAKRPLLRL